MDYGQVVETGSVIQVFSDPRSDIARRFVGNLIRDVIPEPLVESIRRETRNSRLLRIKLENTDSTEPLLWEINRRFEVHHQCDPGNRSRHHVSPFHRNR